MNIVVIRQGAIGDSLLSFPVLAALRARYTGTHITFIGNPNTLQLAKTWGIAEEVFNYEDRLLKELSKHISRPSQAEMFSVLQKAPMLEVAQHLQQCRYYLGNDSGIGHLAGMLGVSTLILFGPTSPSAMSPVAMHPVGPRIEVIQEKSLKRLSPDRVLERMLRHLA